MALLTLLSVHHLSKGFYYLAVQEPATGVADLRHVLQVHAYFVDGINPLSQYFQNRSSAEPELRQWAAGADPTERHGPVPQSGWPPWGYVLQLPFYPPVGERLARVHLAALDALALGGTAWFAWSMLEGRRALKLLAVLSFLAIGATNAALTQGQNSLLINCGLALGTAYLLRTGPWNAGVAGLWLIVSMVKPSTAMPFLLMAACRRRWAAIAVCVVGTAAAAWFVAWYTNASLVYQMQQFTKATEAALAEGANVLLRGLVALNLVSPALVRNWLAASVFAATALVLWRRHPVMHILSVLGVLAVSARVWTYHRAYDDVMLGFLLLALLNRAVHEPSPRMWWAGWACCGLTLWLPYSLYTSTPAQAVQTIIWIGAAMALVVWPDTRDSPSDLPSPSRP